MTAAAPNNNQPSINELANSAGVSWIFASKIVAELKKGQLKDQKTKMKNIPRGKGSIIRI
jgi:DNA-binding transcriptional regulator YhcF (GntR family)